MKYLNSLNGGKPTLSGWMIGTLTSGFVGVMAALVCKYYQVDSILMYAITGIAAHHGAQSIYVISDILKNHPQASQVVTETSIDAARMAKKKEQDNGTND